MINPIDTIDPLGLWQVTIVVAVGWGAELTFGDNGGQWNDGIYIGAGEAGAVDIDIYDRGSHCKETNWGLQGTGQIGLGPHVEADTHVGGPDPWWNVNAGFGDSPAGVSIGSDGATVPTLGFGEAEFVGAGETTYF